MNSLLVAAWAIVLTGLIGGGAWLYLVGQDGPTASDNPSPHVSMALNAFRSAEPLDPAGAMVDGQSPVSDGDDASKASPPDKPAGAARYAAAGMHPHPDPLLIEKSDLGPLPTIGKDGRHPWRVYSRPFSGIDTRPRIAIVVTGLGVSANATAQTIDRLPGSVTLSFAPFAKKLRGWIDKSRAGGHEVLIDLPMEPRDYPANDPGPHTLLASVPIDQNLRQLEWILSRATGYVGVSTFMGSGLATKPRALTPILTELKTRGLMLVDTRENPVGKATDLSREMGLTVVTGNIFIDQQPASDIIDDNLRALEDRAKRDGAAIGIARPYPVTIKRLAAWIDGLGAKGIALAPTSALAAANKSGK